MGRGFAFYTSICSLQGNFNCYAYKQLACWSQDFPTCPAPCCMHFPLGRSLGFDNSDSVNPSPALTSPFGCCPWFTCCNSRLLPGTSQQDAQAGSAPCLSIKMHACTHNMVWTHGAIHSHRKPWIKHMEDAHGHSWHLAPELGEFLFWKCHLAEVLQYLLI